MSELKPCPFCGGSAGIEKRGTHRQSMIISCHSCGCDLESGDVIGLTDPQQYQWNTRPREDKLVEALRDIRGWRERDRQDLGDVLRWIEDRVDAALKEVGE